MSILGQKNKPASLCSALLYARIVEPIFPEPVWRRDSIRFRWFLVSSLRPGLKLEGRYIRTLPDYLGFHFCDGIDEVNEDSARFCWFERVKVEPDRMPKAMHCTKRKEEMHSTSTFRFLSGILLRTHSSSGCHGRSHARSAAAKRERQGH